MTKREMEDKIITLEVQVQMLIAMQRPHLPQPANPAFPNAPSIPWPGQHGPTCNTPNSATLLAKSN